MPAERRPLATVLAEIAEVRHHLHEAPPHHDGGAQALRRRLGELEAEVAAIRRAARSSAQRPDQLPGDRPDRRDQRSVGTSDPSP